MLFPLIISSKLQLDDLTYDKPQQNLCLAYWKLPHKENERLDATVCLYVLTEDIRSLPSGLRMNRNLSLLCFRSTTQGVVLEIRVWPRRAKSGMKC